MKEYLTVGELRKELEGLPDDMPVYYQRIEDFYFTEHNWGASSKHLTWDQPPDTSEYIKAFSAYEQDGVFVVNAHY